MPPQANTTETNQKPKHPKTAAEARPKPLGENRVTQQWNPAGGHAGQASQHSQINHATRQKTPVKPGDNQLEDHAREEDAAEKRWSDIRTTEEKSQPN